MNVRTLCLGILSFGDATGYEIKKSVEEGMFNHFIEASYGSIYPALTRMALDGLVTCREEAQTGRPDKKVYSINERGRAELTAALRGTPGGDKFKSEFLFVMLLSQMLPPDHVSRIYEERLELLRLELSQMRACAAEGEKPGGRFVVGYGIAMVEAAVAYLEANRHQFVDATRQEQLCETVKSSERA